MTKGALLLVDMLGVRARWHSGGRAAARKAFSTFESIIAKAQDPDDSEPPLLGLVETDSCALVFPTVAGAVRLARRAYLRTFLASQGPKDERLWLRAVVVPYRGTLNFRRNHPLAGSNGAIQVGTLERSLFDAIAAEHSGFRGMRILVGGGLGAGHGARRAVARLEIKSKHFAPFLRVRTPPYPKQLQKGKFYDFMWMATDDAAEAAQLKQAMTNRIKWSASNPEEFLQAAATQVIFNHWDGFIDSVPHGRSTR